MSDNTLESLGYTQELSRTLKLRDLVIYGLIFIVPIAPFGIFGHVMSASGGMIVTAYVIGLVGMLFTAICYSQMAKEFPVAGSVYSYVSRGAGSFAGFVAGWIMLLDYILIPALLYVVGALAIHDIFPSLSPILLVVAFVVFNTYINIRGISFTAAFNRWMLVAELLVLAVFLVVGVVAISNNVNGAVFSMAPVYDADDFSLGLIISAVPIAVLSFLGFDGISTLAEEAKGGGKAVSKAIFLVLLIIGGLFIAQTWVAALIQPDPASFNNLDTAFYETARIAGGGWLAVLTAATTAIAWGVADSLVAQIATARILYSMGRDRLLPAPLARVHPRFKTPYVSALLVGAVSIVAGIAFMQQLALLTSIVTIGALTAFIILNITTLYYFVFKKKAANPFLHILCPLLGLAVVGYIWSGFESYTVLIGLAWAVVGVGVYAFAKRGGRAVQMEI
ncbi:MULTISPECIES: APC family permease [unclassified Halomonas]|uniref:APC family permease n=1 Tax=Halomonas sp. RT37 TaxID=2950872 RepID=A0AAU7KL90_9GAMM|nr:MULTISPECIES: APC family permease [unclassified Halomonas]MBR9773348.1 APC family permease [Gammaproteobacteria bacterium]MAR72800.1 amino acid permease [Halomonas sp.]MBR9880666.1 APC family permease [Gammaproteobacteria bacterium]MBY6108865.1 APC family permease [Halomonas sp. DP1Y21-3]MCJ8286299.1 APC family permease [Halomonas sp.]